MKQMKKVMSMMLVICILVTLMPVSAFAAKEQPLQIDIKPGIVKVAKLDSFEDSITTYELDENGNPTITDTNEVRWIDRLADLPDWAMEFYDWMAENSDGDGSEDALINPTSGELYELGSDDYAYVHQIAELPEQALEFEFTPGATESEIQNAAKIALEDKLEENFYEDFSWMLNAYGLFDRDYSDVFWLSGEMAYGYDLAQAANFLTIDDAQGIGTILYTQCYHFYLLQPDVFDVREPQYRDYTIVYEAIGEREELVEGILAEAEGTREEILAYFNDYLTYNNGYNTSEDLSQISNNSYECISALEGNAGVEGPICEGYSRAFKLLCDRSGIPCVIVNGTSYDVNHMWNNVEMEDGKWYAIDVTFNDPIVEGNEDKVSGSENDDYFLVGNATVINEETFGETHVVTNMIFQDGTQYVNGPVLEEDAYRSEDAPHVHSYTAVITEPTCTEDGFTTYNCLECGDVYTEDVVPATGHDYAAPTFVWTEDYSECTATFVCANECGEDVVNECTVSISSEDATCTTPGTIVYTAVTELDGQTYTDEKSEMRELGHNYVPEFTWTDDRSACIAVFTCANGCGETGTVNCTVSVEETEETITYTAVCEFKGVEYSDKIVKLIEKIEIPFTDVPENAWYTPYVIWAYENDVTAGYQEEDGTYTFRPAKNCTRAEIVKFLWNLVGTSVTEDMENPFTDVDADDWFYECVMWAAANGVTHGYEEADGTYTFRPNATCTRAEVAGFIYNIKGGEPVSDKIENPFTDVETGKWYSEYVLWGYDNGIINGYEMADGTLEFRPFEKITRAEVVTMLHGAYTKNPVTGIALEQKTAEIIIGDSQQLSYVIAPADADIKNVRWASSDESIATVTEDGLVTAVAKGQAVITVTTKDGGYTAQCEVTVKEPELVAKALLGIRTFTTDTTSSSEVYVKADVTGGSGIYVEYHIKLYYEGELIAESDKEDLAATPIQNGTYTAELYVKDSSGTEDITTATMTVSMQ